MQTDLNALKAALDVEVRKWWSLHERMRMAQSYDERRELRIRASHAHESVRQAQQRIKAHYQNEFVRSAMQ